jgi:hypothetical protein
MVFAVVRDVQDIHNMRLLFLHAVMQLKVQFSCDVAACCQGILGVLAPEDRDTKGGFTHTMPFPCRYGMCESNTAALCKSNGKDTI